jgi:hypothetical protein
VNHSSAPPSHGLAPAATGFRHDVTRLARKKRNENPMIMAPTVESWFRLVHPLVLRNEGDPEADEKQPEVDLAEPLVQHPPEHLRVPEVEPGEPGEHRGPDQHLVEVGHHEVGVMGHEVHRGRSQQYAGHAAHQEGD